jgi:hypothetical protein
MKNMLSGPRAFLLFLLALLAMARPGASQAVARPDPADPAHPFNTPAAAATPASDAQFAAWRKQARAALFIPEPMPAPAAREYGSFSPMPGVVAHRVTYASLYGMRVPAIVYRPGPCARQAPCNCRGCRSWG